MRRLFYLLTIAAGVVLLSGCKVTRVVEQVPVEVRDTVYEARVLHDSVWVDRVREVVKRGDTVYVTNEVSRVQVVTKWDTAYRVVERPVTVSKTETVEVEKPLRWWQRGLMWCGVVGVIGVVGVVGCRLLRRRLPGA